MGCGNPISLADVPIDADEPASARFAGFARDVSAAVDSMQGVALCPVST